MRVTIKIYLGYITVNTFVYGQPLQMVVMYNSKLTMVISLLKSGKLISCCKYNMVLVSGASSRVWCHRYAIYTHINLFTWWNNMIPHFLYMKFILHKIIPNVNQYSKYRPRRQALGGRKPLDQAKIDLLGARPPGRLPGPLRLFFFFNFKKKHRGCLAPPRH